MCLIKDDLALDTWIEALRQDYLINFLKTYKFTILNTIWTYVERNTSLFFPFIKCASLIQLKDEKKKKTFYKNM